MRHIQILIKEHDNSPALLADRRKPTSNSLWSIQFPSIHETTIGLPFDICQVAPIYDVPLSVSCYGLGMPGLQSEEMRKLRQRAVSLQINNPHHTSTRPLKMIKKDYVCITVHLFIYLLGTSYIHCF